MKQNTDINNPERSLAPVPESFQKIQRFVVLMLENRSFDHLIGSLKSANSSIDGLSGNEFNYQNPNVPGQGSKKVWNATEFTMPFDPDHEFKDVQIQLYGPSNGSVDEPNQPTSPAAMSGFLSRGIHAANTANTPDSFPMVMEYFAPSQIPVMSTLATQFALCNFWFSSLPGPTWPNRFFIHAATSGGLTDSPTETQVLGGYSFSNGTIYDRLEGAKKNWRIYHDSLPQSIGIDSLRLEYIDPLTKHFRGMNFFAEDVKNQSLPEYTFIEPLYDIGNNYRNGNSMHPLNDVRKGEQLVKQVYETLRNSSYWSNTMLIVLFDEHGGFYDHVSPPRAIPPGDAMKYATTNFAFDFLGVRVPAILISAYTQRGMVIGNDPAGAPIIFDHTSVLATVEKRFQFKSLTKRDAAARTIDLAVNLANPRTSSSDAPTELPSPLSDSILKSVQRFFAKAPGHAEEGAKLSSNQKSFLALALTCDLKMSEASKQAAIKERVDAISRQKEAAQYLDEIETKIRSSRKESQ